MRIVYQLSEPADFSPIYNKPVPIELFRLDGILFDRVYDTYLEFFPEAETDVIGGGHDTVSVITDRCDLLSVPSSNLFTKVFVFSAFCAAMGRTGFCLFHPGNHLPRDMEALAPVVRAVMKDDIASSGLVFYSFKASAEHRPGKTTYLKKGEKYSESKAMTLFGVKEFSTERDIDAWKKDHKDGDASEVFCPGSNVFSFNPVTLMETITAGNEDLLALYHLTVKAWEEEGSIRDFLNDSVKVLDGFEFFEMVRSIDDKFFVRVDSELFRGDKFSDLLEYLPLDGDGNYVFGPAETHNVKRSAIINQSEKKVVVSDLKDVLVLANAEGTGVRSML